MTAPIIQIVDFHAPMSEVTYALLVDTVADAILPEAVEDVRPIVCAGLNCDCRQYGKYDHIAGLDYCSCRHSLGLSSQDFHRKESEPQVTAAAKVKAAATDPATIGWSIMWLSLPVTFGILEGRAWATGESEDTLSDNLRRLFRTNTRGGRTVWALTWGLFSAAFAAHILGSDVTDWR